VAEPAARLRAVIELLRAGRAGEAEAACRALLASNPRDPRALALLGNLLLARGALDEAAATLAAALHIDPQCVPALVEDANLALRQGDPRRALARMDAAVTRVAATPALLYLMAQAAIGCQLPDRARAALAQAQSLDPGEPDSGMALLRLSHWQNDHATAEATAVAVLRRQPHFGEAWRLLGESRQAAGQLAEALQAFAQGATQATEDIPLHEAWARALDAQGAPAVQRIAARERLLAIDPGAMRACELGLACWSANRLDQAASAFERALALDADCLPARWALFQYPREAVHQDSAAVDAFRAQWQSGLDAFAQRIGRGVADPPDALAAATLCSNFYYHYTTDAVLDGQRRYARVIEQLVRASLPEHAPMPPVADDGRVRVAVFSAHLFAHTITRLFGGMLRGLDRSRVRLAFFQHGGDATIRAELAAADDLIVSGQRDPASWAQAIRAFAPAVVLHTDLGMEPMAQCLAALRLAPTQAVLWGHPISTGFEHIDVFISSAAMETEGAADRYTEKLLLLPGLGTCFAAPSRTPRAPAELARRDPARVEYLFLQSVFKNLPLHDAVLARIAAALPAARFHLTPHADPAISARVRERLAGQLRRANLDPDRHLGIVRGLPPVEFLGLARAGDVNLDSIGWSGGNTTLEALWFDIPTVTLPGASMRTRHTAAMLEILELERLIATDIDDYVRIAVELGRSADLRTEIRALIAERKHRLYDDRRVIAALEDFCIDPQRALSAPAMVR